MAPMQAPSKRHLLTTLSLLGQVNLILFTVVVTAGTKEKIMQTSLFDVIVEEPVVETTSQVTARAVNRSGDNANPLWKNEVRHAIAYCIRNLGEFTSDDVWAYLKNNGTATTAEPRALGSLIREAKADGLIVATGKYRQSNRPECHQNPKMIWQTVRA